MNKPYLNAAAAAKKDDDFGFSFSFHDENETPLEEVEALIAFKNAKLNELRAKVMPFLQRLANSKGDIIKWPYAERQKQISDFMKEIDVLVDNAVVRKKGFDSNVRPTEATD